jgi:hypothetical protein
MKAPNLKNLAQTTTKSAFEQAVQQAQTSAGEMKKKTFTLEQRHIDYINQKSLDMAQQRGKTMPASEALRLILEQHQGSL